MIQQLCGAVTACVGTAFLVATLFWAIWPITTTTSGWEALGRLIVGILGTLLFGGVFMAGGFSVVSQPAASKEER